MLRMILTRVHLMNLTESLIVSLIANLIVSLILDLKIFLINLIMNREILLKNLITSLKVILRNLIVILKIILKNLMIKMCFNKNKHLIMYVNDTLLGFHLLQSINVMFLIAYIIKFMKSKNYLPSILLMYI